MNYLNHPKFHLRQCMYMDVISINDLFYILLLIGYHKSMETFPCIAITKMAVT